mmetsp:Transcript_120837/g.188763  ORF Transcript_120837/g.188763 Transcript_120837/m.188763 type:complete len:1127 (-) Transcript_120837:97-3477(-)
MATGSPNLVNFKNVATSQSAPNYTPIRRRLASDSPQSSSPESAEGEPEVAEGNVTDVQTTATDAHAQQDSPESRQELASEADAIEEEDDDQEDDSLHENASASNMNSIVPFAPGVSVLQAAQCSSEEEDEGDRENTITAISTETNISPDAYFPDDRLVQAPAVCDKRASFTERDMRHTNEDEGGDLEEDSENEENAKQLVDVLVQAKATEGGKRQKIQKDQERNACDKQDEGNNVKNQMSAIFAQSALLADSFFGEPSVEPHKSMSRVLPNAEHEQLPSESSSCEQKKAKGGKRQKILKEHQSDVSHKQVEKKTPKLEVASVSSQSSQLAEPSLESNFEGARDSQGLDQPIVPVDNANACQLVLSSAGAGDSWGGCPIEADNWSVQKDSCSLELGGKLLKLPRSVFDRLFHYQRQGVAWMWDLFQKEFGGILADEMGLGKTVQVAAFLSCLKFSNQGSRFLVVVPPTLLEQWRRELKSWSADTGLAVHVMHGTQQERRNAIRGMINRGGVMLTSYELARNASGLNNLNATNMPKKRKKQTKRGCRDDDSPSEEEEEDLIPSQIAANQDGPWDAVIVDEGHQIKNPSCLVGRALRKIEAKSRFLLTGTPLQNKLSDLWALMDFAQPGLLGNHTTFERTFSEQIEKGSKRNATPFAVELKDHLARELKRLTAPHFLRRLKDEVLQTKDSPQEAGAVPENLPPKTDVVLWLNLTNAQLELYNLFLGSETVRRATAGKNGMEALRAIAMLKKLCNNPLLCLPKEEFAEWRQRIVPSASAAKAAGQQKPKASQTPAIAPDQEDAFDDDATQPALEDQDFLARLRAMMPGSSEGAALLSCKLKVLGVLLPQLQKRGHRCLIFSHSTRMLDLIQACVLRVLGLKFLRIDGTIDPKDRDVKVTKFQAPDSRYFCMCLSSQVGGVGLTITGADRVILADPAWNPAMDAQAIDRVHRLGQQRDVVVYRLVGSGGIEDKMFRLQVFKRSLAKTAMEQESQLRFFTNKELKQLFEPPNLATSTQTLMSEQLGVDALEHEGLLNVVADDIGSTDDADAMPFWQSSDVLGFSDYQRLFMYLEQTQKAEEEEVEKKAKDFVQKLRSEEYVADQVIEGKWRSTANKENISTQEQGATPLSNE